MVKIPLSYGEKAVGKSFNPNGNFNVDIAKAQFAALIDYCDQHRSAATDNEVKRMYSVAITEMQTAQMWMIKAITWSDE